MASHVPSYNSSAATLEIEEACSDAPRRTIGGEGNANWNKNERKEIGICLSWKDVWVTASVGRNGSKTILEGLTGYAKPGQLLAIMGPSGMYQSDTFETPIHCMIFLQFEYQEDHYKDL
ncbi:ABC transporter G family member 11, partial [Mucuna pruriens]